MSTRIVWQLYYVTCLLSFSILTPWAQAAEQAVLPSESGVLSESLVAGTGDSWDIEAVAEQEFIEALDGEIQPVQMLAPQRRLGNRVAQRPQRSLSTRSRSGSATVPFMIGDTSAGTCVSFRGLIDIDLAHPTLTCSRLNISEGNSPLPTDRIFASYRHFRNATPFRYYQFQENFNYDTWNLGGERTFFDQMMSLEVRVPIENRLSSDLFTYDVFDPPLFLPFAPGFQPFGGGKRTELGNISLILKALLHESCDFALSAGLGATLPTARDVTYLITTDNPLFFPDTGGFADSAAVIDIFASNETVYLSPFLAWMFHPPQQRFFHQGFMQVEVAANPMSMTIAGSGAASYTNGDYLEYTISDPLTPTQRLPLYAQTLMRLNLGFGYILKNDPNASLINQLTALFEVHYTSTLNDAKISEVVVVPSFQIGTPVPPTIEFGNLNNRINIVNMVAGLSAKMGNWVVTNGVTVPLRDGPDRGFDFEYNLQIQRPF